MAVQNTSEAEVDCVGQALWHGRESYNAIPLRNKMTKCTKLKLKSSVHQIALGKTQLKERQDLFLAANLFPADVLFSRQQNRSPVF